MKKILIVEDEVQIGKAYKDHLERAGFNVEMAHNGEEGIILAKSFIPDIILLDIIMPILDGLNMLKKLKDDEKLSKIPVIILTNLNTKDSIAGVMANGVTNYLIKSDHSMEDLDLKIRGVLDDSVGQIAE